MRTIVLLASYLGDKYRHLSIIKALESVAKNTVKPQIWVSYSYPESGAPNIKEWAEVTKGLVTFFYDQGTGRKSQFEHMEFLSQNIQKEDIVMFLDDDDLYTQDRVEVIEAEFRKHPEAKIIKSGSSCFGDPWEYRIEEEPRELYTQKTTEFTNFCIKGSLLSLYFQALPTFIGIEDVKKDFYDIVLVYFLEKRRDISVDIENILYYKRIFLPKHYVK